jgi:hypothetical protein
LLKNGVSLTPPILGSNLSPYFLTGLEEDGWIADNSEQQSIL